MYAFLPSNADLNQRQLQNRLYRAGFTDIDSARVRDTGVGVFGVRVRVNDEEAALNVLEACDLPYLGHVTTPIESVGGLTLDIWVNVAGHIHPNTPADITIPPELLYTVQLGPFNHQTEVVSRFKDPLKAMAATIERPIVCKERSRPKNLAEPAGDRNEFSIWVWSSADRDTGRPYPPREMWGHRVYHSGLDGYLPSELGLPIIDEASGWCAAEVFRHHLFVHHALLSNDESDALILAEILRQATEFLMLDEAEWDRHLEVNEAKARTKAEADFVLIGGGNFMKELNGKRQQLNELSKEIPEAQTRLNTLINRQQHLSEEVTTLEAGENETSYEVEFDRILNHPKVTDLTIDENIIRFTTTPLFCQNPKTGIVHKMGRQQISIDTDKTDMSHIVQWKCLDGKLGRNDYPAPHVIYDGYACLGNAGTTIRDLAKKQEWEQLVWVAIQFVESVNIEDSAGKTIVEWPHATPNELVGTEWEGLMGVPDDPIGTFAEIPGIGPVTEERIRHTLDVRNLDALMEAAQAGRLTEVPGINERRANMIREGLVGHERAV